MGERKGELMDCHNGYGMRYYDVAAFLGPRTAEARDPLRRGPQHGHPCTTLTNIDRIFLGLEKGILPFY